MNDHTHADINIKNELRKILSFNRNLPAFKKGKIYMDFDTGKVRIETNE